MTFEYAIAEPLGVAAAKALRAHHLLGRLTTCDSLAEFASAATELVALTRAVTQSIARLRDDAAAQRSELAAWLHHQMTTLERHPLETMQSLPSLYAARLAAGSSPPPFEGLVRHRADEFYFEGHDKRPALELCADYLDRVTKLLDETREQTRRTP